MLLVCNDVIKRFTIITSILIKFLKLVKILIFDFFLKFDLDKPDDVKITASQTLENVCYRLIQW